jgi:glutathione peroxidase
MKKSILFLALAAGIAGASVVGSAVADDKAATPAAATDKPAALNFTVKDIDGKDVDLSTYKGKVIMMLNVASKCGNTPQYEALESLYAKYKDKGFVIMGFPANNFGGQEPGTNAEIKEFCTSTYDVKFPMFSKVSVKGNDMAPLFKYLTSQDCKPLSKGDIAWNFEKFLISRDGKLVARFGNRTKPDDKTIVAAIEQELNASPQQ